MNVEVLKTLNRRMERLLDDPHPGLITWVEALYTCIDEINADVE